jgi:hypothetical protein
MKRVFHSAIGGKISKELSIHAWHKTSVTSWSDFYLNMQMKTCMQNLSRSFLFIYLEIIRYVLRQLKFIFIAAVKSVLHKKDESLWKLIRTLLLCNEPRYSESVNEWNSIATRTHHNCSLICRYVFRYFGLYLSSIRSWFSFNHRTLSLIHTNISLFCHFRCFWHMLAAANKEKLEKL